MIYSMKNNSLREVKNNILINKGGKEGVSEIPSLSIFNINVRKTNVFHIFTLNGFVRDKVIDFSSSSNSLTFTD